MRTLILLALPVVVAACQSKGRHFAPGLDGGSTTSASSADAAAASTGAFDDGAASPSGDDGSQGNEGGSGPGDDFTDDAFTDDDSALGGGGEGGGPDRTDGDDDVDADVGGRGGGLGLDDDDSSAGDGGSSAGTAIGAPCESKADCALGYCSDGVCCAENCEFLCARCDAPGFEGTCTAAERDEACGELQCASGTECRAYVLVDEVNCVGIGECLLEAPCEEVLEEAGVPCQNGEGTCDGNGECVVPDKLLLGEPCGADDECSSGACVDAVDGTMRCCESACDGLCEACAADGQCDAVPMDDSRCAVVTCPSDTSCTDYPANLSNDRCAALGQCFTAATHCQPDHEAEGVGCGSGLACDGQGSCDSVCTTSQLWCAGSCINPTTNNSHCGQCGNACSAGLICSNGDCVPNCGSGEVTCDETCVDPSTDEDYCGATGDCLGPNAGVACTSGLTCVGGTCTLVCPAGQINCDNTCINPNTDEEFCGAAGNCAGANEGVSCLAGYACESGVCRLQCPAGQVGCDGSCINPSTDEDYCGASGYCEGANDGEECTGSEQCVSGTCRVPNGQSCSVNTDCISNTCTTFHADNDGDGFGATSSGTQRVCGASPPSSAWVSNDLDCCDEADVTSDAFETNPDYSGGPRTDGATGCSDPYDWDCDGTRTELYDTTNCTSYTTEATCPYAWYTGTVPECGDYGNASLCGWTGTQCINATGGSIQQACY